MKAQYINKCYVMWKQMRDDTSEMSYIIRKTIQFFLSNMMRVFKFTPLRADTDLLVCGTFCI